MNWVIGIVVGGIVALIAYLIATSLITGLANEGTIVGLICLLLWAGLAYIIAREYAGRRRLP